MPKTKYDVVIVGAGPGGAACGKIAAEKGLRVLMFERGRWPGEKNHSGCSIFPRFMKEIIPNFEEVIPTEVMGGGAMQSMRYLAGAITLTTLGPRGGFGKFFIMQPAEPGAPPLGQIFVFRNKFDKWFAEQAVKAGVELRCSTLVTDIIRDGAGAVKGVITDTGEKIEAPITIAADGSNSIIARRASLRPKYPRDNAVFVRHIYEMPPELPAFPLAGYYASTGWVPVEEMGYGYTWGVEAIYEGKRYLMICGGGFVQPGGKLGSMLTSNANYLIHRICEHPGIKPFVEASRLVYYDAHMDPCPVLLGCFGPTYTDGLMAVGDAGIGAGFLGWGMMNATDSGKWAAETAYKALNKMHDVSAAALAEYEATWKKARWVVDAATEEFLHAKLASADGLGPLLKNLYKFSFFEWGPERGMVDLLGDAVREVLVPLIPNLLNMCAGFKPILESAVRPYTNISKSPQATSREGEKK